MIAGIGFSSACTPDELAALLASTRSSIDALATPEAKAGHTLVTTLAFRLGVPIIAVTPEALTRVQPLCPTRSERARQETGLAAIAEACALAASGPGARLVLPRIASAHATCALAEGATP